MVGVYTIALKNFRPILSGVAKVYLGNKAQVREAFLAAQVEILNLSPQIHTNKHKYKRIV